MKFCLRWDHSKNTHLWKYIPGHDEQMFEKWSHLTRLRPILPCCNPQILDCMQGEGLQFWKNIPLSLSVLGWYPHRADHSITCLFRHLPKMITSELMQLTVPFQAVVTNKSFHYLWALLTYWNKKDRYLDACRLLLSRRGAHHPSSFTQQVGVSWLSIL